MGLEVMIIPAGAFLAAFVVGAAGFGDALVMAAVWLHFIDPVEAVPLIVASGLLMHTLPLYRLRRELQFDRLAPFVLAGVVGVPVGTTLLKHLDPDPFRLATGVFLIAYSLFVTLGRDVRVAEAGGRAADGAIGLAGGVLGGLAGLSGVLPTLWAGLRGWSKERQRGVYQPFVWVMHLLTLAGLAWTGILTAETGVRFLWCVPAVVVGSGLGLVVYRHLDETRFRRIVLLLLLVSGAGLVV